MRRAARLLAPAIVLGLLLGACGGSDSFSPPVGTVVGGDEGGAPDATPSPDTSERFRFIIVPLHDLSQPLPVGLDGELQIFVRVIDLVADAPAEGVPLAFALEQTDPPAGSGADGSASLSSQSVLTDTQGMATVIFRAGSVPTISYDLRVSTDLARSVVVPIVILDQPRGDLKVKIKYVGPVPLAPLKVSLKAGNTYNCTKYHAENPPKSDAGEKTLADPGATTTFEGLPVAQRYAVLVRGWTTIKSEGSKHLAAAGCLDGVFVPAGASNQVTVSVHVLPLRLAGTYRVTGNYDMTNVAVEFLNEQGLAGQILADVITFFNDPGTVIVKYVEEAAKQFLPGLAVDIVFDLIGDPIADALSSWLLDIPELQDFFQIGQDVTGVVSKLEMVSLIKFSKVFSDYSLNGLEEYIGLNLFWKLGCDKNAPDYDQCGKYPFSLEDFNNPNFPLELVSATFTANLVNWNTLAIDPHVVQINYGKLVLFVMNHMILPEIANGATSLSEAFKNLMDCSGLGGIAGFGKKEVQKACNSAIGLIAGFIEGMIGGLNWDSNLTLGGSALLVDDSDNLVVDRIVEGKYTGSVVISGTKSAAFTATFAGVRDVK